MNKAGKIMALTGALILAGIYATVANAATCTISPETSTITEGDSVTFSAVTSDFKGKKSYAWTFEGGAPASSTASTQTVTYDTPNAPGSYAVSLTVSSNKSGSATCSAIVTVNEAGGGFQPPTCSIDKPATNVTIEEGDSVNYTGTITEGDGAISAITWNFLGGSPASSDVANPGNVVYNSASTYITTLDATDSNGETCVQQTRTITVNPAGPVPPPPDIGLDIPQTDFKIMMNYELGMHCTGFEFAYCCVLPAYNSILAQVVKPETASGLIAPRLLDAHPTANRDLLDRQTVLRDVELDSSGNFKKYVLKYWHDAQPRNNFIDGQLVGKQQDSILISEVENNSLLSWNTVVDAGKGRTGAPDALNYGEYNGAFSALKGNGITGESIDNYQNAIWNHLYIYADPDHQTPAGPNLEGHPDSNWLTPTPEGTKLRLGVDLPAYPENCGPAYHPMGPDAVDDPNNPSPGSNTCGGLAKGSLLTYSGERGTIVFTEMKVVENLPIMLTSPRIWEALGLPLTPFEDTIDFFADPGLVDEDSIRPYVAMKARLYNYDASAPGGVGTAVFDANGPVTGFGTAPIDIPNCERCHAAAPDNGSTANVNSPSHNLQLPDGSYRYGDQAGGDALAAELWAQTTQEYNFWLQLFPSMQSKSDWYARLKSAAINMLALHDMEHDTHFTDNYPGVECDNKPDPIATGDLDNTGCNPSIGGLPQNTRLNHESIICQKCHADNVIAVVRSACTGGTCGPLPGEGLIKPVTEAIHWNHRNIAEGGTIAQHDAFGRDGGCQGCHPAHRSDGDMSGYPITKQGDNFYAESDNRLANGGCFVGRDVHSNPLKDVDGAETPEHLNAVGQWLADNVFRGQAQHGITAPDGSNPDTRGIWCTNCHTQLSQELWKRDDCEDLVNGVCTDNNGDPVTNLRNADLQTIADEVAGGDLDKVKSWLDPKTNGMSADTVDRTHEIWDKDPSEALVAVLEVNSAGGFVFRTPDDDPDGYPKVNILSFCTTPTCLADINDEFAPDGTRGWNYKVYGLIEGEERDEIGVAVPFAAATDGGDHWLSPGEPHCADCHTAPYVEQSGNNNFFPPFNYPRKASLMRYSRGHQDISCQGCHESIHGLYPVTPNIDTTSYAQAAALNADGSHGPLKCATCHQTRSNGTPLWAKSMEYQGTKVSRNFDAAVSWMHTYTEEADPREDVCLNCHTTPKDWEQTIVATNKKWVEHTYRGRVSRGAMSAAEIATWGHVLGDTGVGSVADTLDGLCNTCHTDGRQGSGTPAVSCNTAWKNHLIQGRADEEVWKDISAASPNTGFTTCGWEDPA
jgi:hypothetical protein